MTAWFLSLISLICLIAVHAYWRKKYILLLTKNTEFKGHEKHSRLVKDLGMTDIFDNMPEGILVTNSKRKIDFANPAFCKMFGLSENPSGKTVMEAIRIHQANELIDQLETKSSVTNEEFMLPNLDQRFLQSNGVAIRGKNGKNRGAILVFHDITRIKMLENHRQEFVANVSHELRTPLSIIKGYVETLIDAETNAESNTYKFLKKIENHSDRLTFLIEDILTLSQLESGGIALEQNHVNIYELTESIFDSLKEMAEKKGIHLKNQVAKEFVMMADNRRMFQALNNLIENGIKYGGQCVCVSSEINEEKIVICVQDDGPGIPVESCERIFERFYRVDKARSREIGGTGLGLSIVKHVTQLHNGTARVESSPGNGACFYLTFPNVKIENNRV